MHLVHEPVGFGINDRGAVQEFCQQRRTSWSIDSCKSRDDTAAGENQLFRVKQYPASLALRIGLAFFGYARAVALRVHAGAARKHQFCSGESFEEIARAVDINSTIDFGIAATRTRTVDNCVEGSCAVADLNALRNIYCTHRIWFRSKSRRRFRRTSPPFYCPVSAIKQIGRRFSNVTTPGNQDSSHAAVESAVLSGESNVRFRLRAMR